MVNCPKCRTCVDHPVKSWRIKQTPIALYECPSCGSKWRSKTDIATEALAPQLEASNPKVDQVDKETQAISGPEAGQEAKPMELVTPTTNPTVSKSLNNRKRINYKTIALATLFCIFVATFIVLVIF
jgi:uncharacterized protein YlaI